MDDAFKMSDRPICLSIQKDGRTEHVTLLHMFNNNPPRPLPPKKKENHWFKFLYILISFTLWTIQMDVDDTFKMSDRPSCASFQRDGSTVLPPSPPPKKNHWFEVCIIYASDKKIQMMVDDAFNMSVRSCCVSALKDGHTLLHPHPLPPPTTHTQRNYWLEVCI